MAAATADRKTSARSTGRTFTADLAAATKIWLGTLVAVNAAGYAVPASDTAALKVIGVALSTVDNTGAAGAKSITVETGVFKLVNLATAIVQASKHKLCYVGDDQSVTTAAVAANDVVAGIVDAIDTDGVWVYVAPENGALA